MLTSAAALPSQGRACTPRAAAHAGPRPAPGTAQARGRPPALVMRRHTAPRCRAPSDGPRGLGGWLATKVLEAVLPLPMLRTVRELLQDGKTYRINGSVAAGDDLTPGPHARVQLGTQPAQVVETGWDGTFGGVAVPADGRLVRLDVSAPGFEPRTLVLRSGAAGKEAKRQVLLQRRRPQPRQT